MRRFTRYFAGTKQEVEYGIHSTKKPWIRAVEVMIKESGNKMDARYFAKVVFEESDREVLGP